MKQLVFFAFSLLMAAAHVHAKDMNHRLGVGPKLPFSGNLPGVAVHYFPNSDYAFTGALGINTQTNSSEFGIQGGVRRILFEEQNMNFFVGGTLALVSLEFNGNNQSGFELVALSGGEFFFQGLENLGFNFEVGVGVSSVKNQNRFFTLANMPMRAGVIFYF